MDARDEVWRRWVEIHPYDADLLTNAQDMLLDTLGGRALAMRVAAEPLGAMATAMVDRMDTRLARLRDEGLRAALRAWRP